MSNKSKSTHIAKKSKGIEAHFQIHINTDKVKKYLMFILAMAGFFVLLTAMSQCGELELGQPRDQGLVAVFLFLFALLGASLLWHEYRRPDYVLLVLLPIGIAMLYRIGMFDYKSGDYLSCLSYWYEDFKQGGGFAAISDRIGNYNVPYLYFISAISYFDMPDLYMYKLFSVLWDIILAWGCLRLVRVFSKDKDTSVAPLVAFSLALLLPTVALNSALWAQCDVIYGALCVHAVATALRKEYKVSIALIAVAFSFKLQAIFLLPFWGVLWLSGRVKFRELFVFPATYLLTILPAILMGKSVKSILGIYLGQLGEYPKLTLKAPSMYQFIPYGVEVNEELAGRIGIVAAAVFVLVLFVVAWVYKERLTDKTLLVMAVVLCIGVPFFLPHMHERYFFLADVLTLCLACVIPLSVPVFILTELSSRACYFAYFNGRYNTIMYLGDYAFPMGFEAVAMMVALLLSVLMLIYRLVKDKQPAIAE